MITSINPSCCYNNVTIMLAVHLPRIPEYLSISSGATEDVSDICKDEC